MKVVVSKDIEKKLEELNWLQVPCSDKAIENLSKANIPSNWLTEESK